MFKVKDTAKPFEKKAEEVKPEVKEAPAEPEPDQEDPMEDAENENEPKPAEVMQEMEAANVAPPSAHQGPDNVLDILKQETANAVMLWSNYKRYHWLLSGPQFYSLHLMFDTFASDTYDLIDDFAERVRMLGDNPPATLSEFKAVTTVDEAKALKSADMISEALNCLVCSIECMKNGAWIAGVTNDPGSVDLFSKAVQVYEKQRWFLTQLSKGE